MHMNKSTATTTTSSAHQLRTEAAHTRRVIEGTGHLSERHKQILRSFRKAHQVMKGQQLL